MQNLDVFERFMEVAAISDGEMINYKNIASDCGIAAKTVKTYFQILKDTLIGYELPAFRKTIKRKLVQAFQEEHPNARLILVSLDPITRISEGKELLFVTDFFKMQHYIYTTAQ